MADAIINYNKAININPDEAVYWANLSAAYQVLTNYTEAEKAMSKAIDLEPSEDFKSRMAEIKSQIPMQVAKK